MSGVRTVRRAHGPVDAVVAVPGSKSIANRALVCAALAEGTSTVRHVPDGDDTAAMVSCLRALGVGAEAAGDTVTVRGTSPSDWTVVGTAHAGLAGTTSRFVTALASLGSAPVTVDGHPPLRSRPFAPLLDALAEVGVSVAPSDRSGHLPVTVQGPPTSGTVAVRGDVSSQYITALMLIGPHLPGGLRLRLTSPLVSRPYVDMTASVMAWFGIDGVEVGTDAVRVPEGRYRPADVTVEPDASSASYPLAIAAVVGGTVEVPGLRAGALQGDARFAELLAEMGCSVAHTPGGVRVSRDPSVRLRGISVDMADISDLVPTVAAVALFADSPTRVRGVGFIRAKESDRLGDLAHELGLLGADVRAVADGLEVWPTMVELRGARLATHHDHRLAMAFGVVGAAVDGVQVEDPEVVSKSWPGFWSMLDSVIR